ncbi:hypothetical protein Barb4_01041 [Bacteroidales bacterium Barb4]|nr:hypothetical protein Barb4_01041 [Bacteroidales bacterium Barb4]
MFDGRTLIESYIVGISGNQPVGVLFGSLPYQLEKGTFLFFPVNDEDTVEYLVAAVFRINLRKAVHLAVGQPAVQLPAYLLQIAHFLPAQRQPFLPVICLHILYIQNGGRLLADSKQLLIQPVVKTLQHWVMRSIARSNRTVFFDARDTRKPHVLCNLHSVRTPRRNHLPARPGKPAVHRPRRYGRSLVKQPNQLLHIFGRERLCRFNRQHRLCGRSEKYNHVIDVKYVMRISL